jgi:uncharacterized delta-60 repeat protein
LVHRLDDRTTPAAVGSVDPAFAGGTLLVDVGPGDVFHATAVQADGNILLAGTTEPANEADAGRMLIARYRPDGSLDKSFGVDGVANVDLPGHDVARAIAVRPDGTIVVAGYVEQAAVTKVVVVRLNADGTRDADFGVNGVAVLTVGTDARAFALALQPDGRAVAAGISDGNLLALRLDDAGVLDKSFDGDGVKTINLGGSEMAHAVVLTPDGRIVLAGSTTVNPDGKTANAGNFAALRLAADGSAVDFGFGNVTVNGTKAALLDLGGADHAFAAALRPDGKLVLAGVGGPVGRMTAVRLTPTGLPDSTFNGTGTRLVELPGPAEARAVVLQPDGRAVLVGFGQPTAGPVLTVGTDARLVRLTESGAIDDSFGTPAIDLGTPSDQAYAAALDAHGHILVAGRAGADAAAVRVVGTVGLPELLLVSGLPDGSARQFQIDDGVYVPGPDFTVLPGYTGTVRVAAFDVTGDGIPERIAGLGPGGGPQVAVYDGADGRLLASFFAFEQSFTGGVLLAGGDVTGDGRAELAVAADVGGGPRVRVFEANSLSANDPRTLADFFAIDDVNFRGGARPALGDVNNDGRADLVVGAGPGGGPRVALFDGATLAGTPTRLVGDFFVFESQLRNGAFPAAGDLDADGHADLFFGAGPGGAPRIRVIDGRSLLDDVHIATIDDVPGSELATFFAGDPAARQGVTVAVRDVDGDQHADLVTGSGPGLPSEVRVFTGRSILTAPLAPVALQVIDPFAAAVPGGVFVG